MAVSPFEILEPLAAGGMGQVWTGRHRLSGRAVAIKVLTTVEARKREAQEAFRAEARAAAGLDHPNVAWVLDYGLLPPEWAERSQGRLEAGSPYLVSEQARGGDLHRWIRHPPPWRALKEALRCLLDALAFAHARGVIHRDLKPANVLLGTRREERSGILLADFGIAHRLGALPEPGFRPRAGTPTYMAPEQIAGDWRAYGPWTDLYALGVLTWAILQGRAPERSGPAQEEAVAWRDPRIPVPEGLKGWLARLLREDPRERFLRASDAAAALSAMGDEGEGEDPEDWEDAVSDPEGVRGGTAGLCAVTTAHHLIGTPTNQTFADHTAEVRPLRFDVQPMAIPPPAIPEDWRPRRPIAPPLELVDAGLGLYGLRERPLIGRERERDLIWARARRAAREGRGGVLLLSGPLGVGKTRLLRWLCERTEETGLGLAAYGALGEGADAGLLPLLRRVLRLEGLRGAELERHLERAPLGAALSAEERRALLDLVREGAGTQRAGRTSGERYARLLRALRSLARGRVLVLALDEASEDDEGLGLADHLLSRADEVGEPVLLALAARDEALAASPARASRWAELSARPGVGALNLGPLPSGDRPALANAGLHLSPPLRDQVATRSAGNPLFAELLVGDWVRRGVLSVGEDGFELAAGAEPMPASISAAVGDQLQALRQTRPEEDLVALELAAALGLEVDLAEWARARAIAGVAAQPDLLDAGMALRLLRPGSSERSFAFAQTMLREALLEEARAAGRAVAHHAAAAIALAWEQSPGWEHQGRRGRHLLAAQRPAEAVDPLLEAAQGASLTGRYPEERALLDLVEQALPALPVERRDLAAARAWALRGHAAQFGLGDRAEARASYLRAIEAAERAGQPALALDARRSLGGVTFELGDVAQGLEILREALRLSRALGDAFTQSLTALDLTTVLRMAGLREEAEEIGRFSQRVALEAGLEDLIAINSKHSWYLGTLPDDAARIAALRAAITQLAHLEIPGHQGAALDVLGELLRKNGDPDGAMASFRESLRVYDEIGGSYATLPRYNIARMLLEQGRIWEAYPMLRRCLRDGAARGLVFFEPVTRGALAEVELHTGDLEAFDAHVARIRELWSGGGAPERRAAVHLERAAGVALSLGLAERARRAMALAAEIYEAAGAPEAAVRARATLEPQG